MAFGKGNKAREPAVEPVEWATVRKFVISTVERPYTHKRKKPVSGARAVRVPQGGLDFPVNAPCAYLARTAQFGTKTVAGAHVLYEDPESQRPLCSVDAPKEAGEERHHVVRDSQGRVIGTLRRVPPKRPFRHTWRLDQPGHPEIIGRNELVAGDSKTEMVTRVAVKATLGLVMGLLDGGGEGGDQPTRPRTLEWRAGDEIVMVSEGSEMVTIEADWIDRRLAFAFALVGDK
ncbi:hypothetical protein [Streptomyces sp. NBC_00859]|uniref:hypothetical protein n=1 Tax=Streptomyces sp. NBC_00859 TaxID=2903682 RepID=UPI00386C8E2B|nr:hypothetical protein OG584_13990 [Streptomyces sp. NBC_00859]